MYGLTTQEVEQLTAELESDQGPGAEIVPIGPLLAKLMIGAVRAGDVMAMRELDNIMARAGTPRGIRKQQIHQLKAMGPAETEQERAYTDLMIFLKGLQ